MADNFKDLPDRLTDEIEMENARDWLSRLLEMMPVNGTLDYRCFLGAPWRIDFPASELGEIPYHVILGGRAVLEDPQGNPTRKLIAGDILLFPHGSAHALHDGSDAAPAPARQRSTLTTVFHENDGSGDRLAMMCGRFILSAEHERLIRVYLPRRLLLHAPGKSAAAGGPGTGAQVVGLVSLMRVESATENLGGLAMLNALSTALFAVALRLASEVTEPPAGLLALAANPRLVPALRPLQRAGPCLDPSRARSALQHVARHLHSPFSRAPRPFGQRPAHRHSHDGRCQRAQDIGDVHRCRRRACRLPIGGRLPARVQVSNGHHARPVAQDARAPG